MTLPELKVSIGYASEKGIKTANEDFFGSLIPQGSQLIYKGITAAIADGMSGSDAGKEASHCCVVSFLTDYYSTPDSWSVKQAGQKILSATNSWLYSQGHSRYNSNKGMVSTRIWVSKEKNYLNRAMGIEPRLEVDYKSLPIEKR